MDQVDPVFHPTIGPVSKRELVAPSDCVCLWAARLELVRPHAPEGETGLRPISLNTMLRIRLMRQRFTLRNPAMEAALQDTPPLRGFAGVGRDRRPPDEITILRVRHTPEEHSLTKQILVLADATPILASTPTKNAGREHAKLRTAKKGEALHFGMKAHIGGDDGYQGARELLVAKKDVTWRAATCRVKRKVLDKTKIVDRPSRPNRTQRGQCAGQGRTPLLPDQAAGRTCPGARSWLGRASEQMTTPFAVDPSGWGA